MYFSAGLLNNAAISLYTSLNAIFALFSLVKKFPSFSIKIVSYNFFAILYYVVLSNVSSFNINDIIASLHIFLFLLIIVLISIFNNYLYVLI